MDKPQTRSVLLASLNRKKQKAKASLLRVLQYNTKSLLKTHKAPVQRLNPLSQHNPHLTLKERKSGFLGCMYEDFNFNEQYPNHLIY